MRLKFLLVLTIVIFSKNLTASIDIKKLPFFATDMVYSKKLDRLYATLHNDPSNKNYSNTLVQIDPYLGVIEKSIFIGDAPSHLSLYSDEITVYVGFYYSNIYAKVDLEKFKLVNSFELGLGQNIQQPVNAEQIVVMEGRINTTIISTKNGCCSPRHEGVAVYDNGVKRGNVTSPHTGSNVIVATKDSNLYWGYNNETTEFGLRKLVINSSGIREIDNYQGLIDGFGIKIKFFHNKIYSTNGAVIDVSNTVPQKVGQIKLTETFGIGKDLVLGDSLIYFGESLNDFTSITTYSQKDFVQLDKLLIPNSKGIIKTMIPWGNLLKSHFALVTSEYIMILRDCNSLIKEAPEILHPNGLVFCESDSILLKSKFGAKYVFWSNGGRDSLNYIKQTGTHFLQLMDSLGCLSEASKPVETILEPTPFKPFIYPEPLVPLCVGGKAIISTNSFSGKIIWSNNELGEKLIVNKPGTYFCRYVSGLGCTSQPSNPVTVFLLKDTVPPVPLLMIDGDTAFCAGLGSASISTNYAANDYKFEWLKDSNPYSNKPIISFANMIQNSVYQVRVISKNNCISEYSSPVKINIFPFPTKPIIFINGNTIASNYEMGNQWYLDGISIPNATSQFYKATRSGFYQVKIILRNCESPISDIANIILVSNQNESKEVVSRIFPNPSQDFINLVVSSNITTVKICNLQGTLKKKIQYTKASTLRLDISELSPGIYPIYFLDASNAVVGVKKIVKL